ncbi:MAG: BamA/TamA family outer membrane protein, partial [Pseudomonadota bacterium]
QQFVDFRFQEPRFLDRNLSAGLELFSTRSDFLDVSRFESQTLGAGINFGFPISENTGLQLRYRLQTDEINILDRNIIIDEDGNVVLTGVQTAGQDTPNNFFDDRFREVEDSDLMDGQVIVDQCSSLVINRDTSCLAERAELTSLIGYSFNWDRRNDPIAPTGGFDFSISQDIAGLGGDVQYIRTEATGATYRGIFPGVRASVRVSGGAIEPIGDDDSILINNRFFRGGRSFRGFDVAGIGPRQVFTLADDEGNILDVKPGRALGGKVYYQATGELTVPNYLPEEYGIRTKLFVEAGGLGILDDEDITVPIFGQTQIGAFANVGFNGFPVGTPIVSQIKDGLGLRASAGLSVGWDSPFGPIQFDFSQILRKEEYDRTETFRFSTSTRF